MNNDAAKSPAPAHGPRIAEWVVYRREDGAWLGDVKAANAEAAESAWRAHPLSHPAERVRIVRNPWL